MKRIIITEKEDGQITLKAEKGIEWSTFITGIEMLIEAIKENAIEKIEIDDILDDIKRIWERDKNENQRRNVR